jgi:hypothetical protein
MKKFWAVFLIACVFMSGCTGSFVLTKKVYQFHRSMDEKWVDEVVFLVCAIVVYPIATFADSIILNSIEFWSGDNPAGEAKLPDGHKMVTLPDGRIMIENGAQTIYLTKTDTGVSAADAAGTVLYTAAKHDNTVSIFDKNGKLVRAFDAKDKKFLGM